MKDSIRSLKVSNAVTCASAVLVIAFLAVLGSVFISGETLVLANESPEETRIAADIDESYFTTEENARLAQGGKLETRSESEVTETNTDNNDEVEMEADSGTDVNQCENLYLEDHLRIDFDNDQEEVLRLQSFLKTYEGYDYVSLSGTFDEATLRAVKAFQTRYAEDILTPWGYQADEATGYVYITTKQKINEIYCDEQFLLNRQQQTEIREYREKLNQWRSQGASFETPQYLANYYGYTRAEHTGDPQVAADTDRPELEPRTSEGGVTVTETPDETATSATTTEEDDRNFFQRLFGIGGADDEATTTATTSTSTDVDVDEEDEEDETMATTATSTATSSDIDNLAAGVYNGVNGIIDFLLSPTFLLVVLVVLILLLIATLIETDEEEGEGDSEEEEGNESEEVETVETEEETTGEAWEEYTETETVEEGEDLEDEERENQ